jgi:hypothetical protein
MEKNLGESEKRGQLTLLTREEMESQLLIILVRIYRVLRT